MQASADETCRDAAFVRARLASPDFSQHRIWLETGRSTQASSLRSAGPAPAAGDCQSAKLRGVRGAERPASAHLYFRLFDAAKRVCADRDLYSSCFAVTGF